MTPGVARQHEAWDEIRYDIDHFILEMREAIGHDELADKIEEQMRLLTLWGYGRGFGDRQSDYERATQITSKSW